MKEYQLPLVDRQLVAEETMAFFFDASGTDFSFVPGQNADFILQDPPQTDDEGDKRTFSLASSPEHLDRVMITTRMRPTAFKNSLKAIPLGTTVKVLEPSGRMVLPNDPSIPVVLVAGGIGITPFRSMVQWATETRQSHELLLLYSNRTPAATAFREDLEQWAAANPRFRFTATVTDSDDPTWPYEHGRMDRAFFERHVAERLRSRYYLAGPPSMVAALRALLLEMGVNRQAILLESFTGYT